MKLAVCSTICVGVGSKYRNALRYRDRRQGYGSLMRERLPLVPEDLLPHLGAGFRAFVRSIIVSTRARIDRKGQSPAEIACKA